MTNGWENLRIAIVKQAVNDYKKSKKKETQNK